MIFSFSPILATKKGRTFLDGGLFGVQQLTKERTAHPGERAIFLELDQRGNNTVDNGWAVVQRQRATNTDNDRHDRLVDDTGR